MLTPRAIDCSSKELFMPHVVMYSTAICPYCVRAKYLLDNKGISFEEIRIDHHPEIAQEMMRRSNRHTVPQIFIDNFHVGGYDDLASLEMSGRLDQLLGIVEGE